MDFTLPAIFRDSSLRRNDTEGLMSFTWFWLPPHLAGVASLERVFDVASAARQCTQSLTLGGFDAVSFVACARIASVWLAISRV